MESEQKSNLIKGIVILLIIGAAIATYLLMRSSKKNPVELLEEAGQTSVEVPTNPVEGKIPELNPVEQANPFKYENPLR